LTRSLYHPEREDFLPGARAQAPLGDEWADRRNVKLGHKTGPCRPGCVRGVGEAERAHGLTLRRLDQEARW